MGILLNLGFWLTVIALLYIMIKVLPKMWNKADAQELEDKLEDTKKKLAQADNVEEFESGNKDYKKRLKNVKQFKRRK